MTSDILKDFRCEMRMTNRFGQWERRYVVEGALGAAEFWVRQRHYTNEIASILEPDHYGGIEFHKAAPSDRDNAPDHGRCWALSDRACWHTGGSATYAAEVWVPHWEANRENHESIFRRLAIEYRKFFEQQDTHE
jgi:hypothetical protein